jgi:hypothetical protein
MEEDSYIAYHKCMKEYMKVYNINFGGYPTPTISSVTVLLNDNSDYSIYNIEEVELFKKVL